MKPMAWLSVNKTPRRPTQSMDKRNRLTRWDEWEVGKTYVWVKGTYAAGDYKCISVNKKDRFVLLQSSNGAGIQTNGRAWTNRYRRKYQAI